MQNITFILFEREQEMLDFEESLVFDVFYESHIGYYIMWSHRNT